MKNSLPIACTFRQAIAGLAWAALIPLSALAQTAANKPPPRLPPNASESSKIPAGIDSGSPGTSNTVPLGTPVPPDATADQGELRTRSAAARAAARPDPLTRNGAPLAPAAPLVGPAVVRDASRPSGAAPAGRLSCAYGSDPAFRTSMAQCTGMADRAARSSCVERVMDARRETSAPVALPDSGFVGSSASPRQSASLDSSMATRGCI